MATRLRKEGFVACEACHTMKLSCDSDRPCKRCRDRGKGSSCVDHIRKKRTRHYDTGITKPQLPFQQSAVSALEVGVQPATSNAIFSVCFHYFQIQVEQKKSLPPVSSVACLLSIFRSCFSSDQLNSLLTYITSFGDASYRACINGLLECSDGHRLPLESVQGDLLQRLNEAMVPSVLRLESNSVPIVQLVWDPLSLSLIHFCNSQFLSLVDFTRQQCTTMLQQSPLALLDRVVERSSLHDTVAAVGNCFIRGSPTTSFTTILRTRLGLQRPVTFELHLQSIEHLQVVTFVAVRNVNQTAVHEPPSAIRAQPVHSSSYSMLCHDLDMYGATSTETFTADMPLHPADSFHGLFSFPSLSSVHDSSLSHRFMSASDSSLDFMNSLVGSTRQLTDDPGFLS
eukprot:GILK01008118.1.p1 GENE.GILK01008118.1~~GILK01008118.1.p1  ORF type:complete len:405 (-),score=46.22 GILK01008118.1:171-1364(-)